MRLSSQSEHLLVLTKKLTTNYVAGTILAIIGLFLLINSLFLLDTTDMPGLIIGIILLILGTIIFLFGGKHILTVNKEQKIITWDKQRHINKKKKEYALDLAAFISQQVRLEQQRNSNNSTGHKVNVSVPKTIYEYALQFKDGTFIPLGSVSRNFSSNVISAVSGNNSANVPTHVQILADFLNIPIQEDSLGQKMATMGAAGNIVSQILKK